MTTKVIFGRHLVCSQSAMLRSRLCCKHKNDGLIGVQSALLFYWKQ